MGRSSDSKRRFATAIRLAGWVGVVIMVITTTLLVGVIMVMIVGRQANPGEWARWSDVGQTFGASSSTISIVALVVLVVSTRMQFREMREQRQELERQRLELRRGSDIGFRNHHFRLLELAIRDPLLAEVWPEPGSGVSADKNRQLLYANLVYQHVRESCAAEERTGGPDLFPGAMAYIFKSRVMREYWKATEDARVCLPANSAESLAARRIDELLQGRNESGRRQSDLRDVVTGSDEDVPGDHHD